MAAASGGMWFRARWSIKTLRQRLVNGAPRTDPRSRVPRMISRTTRVAGDRQRVRAAVHCSVAGMSAQVPQEFVAQGGIVGGNGSAIISHSARYATSFVLCWLSLTRRRRLRDHAVLISFY